MNDVGGGTSGSVPNQVHQANVDPSQIPGAVLSTDPTLANLFTTAFDKHADSIANLLGIKKSEVTGAKSEDTHASASVQGERKEDVGDGGETANPKLPAADQSAREIIRDLVSGLKELPREVAYNAFLGGLVAVVLAEVMMEMMKSSQAREKIASEGWLGTKEQLIDLAHSIAENIIQRAQLEAMTCIVTAVCAAGAVAIQGFAVGKQGGAATTADSMKWQMVGQAGGTFFNDFLSNVCKAPLEIMKGQEDAEKTITETMKDIASQLLSKLNDEGNNATKQFEDFTQAFKDWLSQLAKIGDKITNRG